MNTTQTETIRVEFGADNLADIHGERFWVDGFAAPSDAFDIDEPSTWQRPSFTDIVELLRTDGWAVDVDSWRMSDDAPDVWTATMVKAS